MPGATPTSRRRTIGRVATRWAVILAILVVFLRMGGCMESLFYVPTRGPTTPPAKYGAEPLWFDSADGTRLHGWFIPAAAVVTDGLPPATILHVHGNAGNIESHVWFTEYLPAAGFNLLVFDYRGYGQSEGRARRRHQLIADTHAALDALLARPDVDPLRIGMYGQSLGGSIGLNVMADRPEIRAAVIESAFDSWRTIAANAIGGSSPGPVSRAVATICIPDGDRPADAIARIDRPLLLLHGTADHIIPIAHSRRLAAAAAGPVELVELPGGDHNTLRSTHLEVDGLVIEFFQDHLTGPAETEPSP
ncbi:MAG: alpha/beta hydrolase [Planctomycetota bacterium]|jgi:dipeptidyl aminopeptidase/acylaminoacyl peptidase